VANELFQIGAGVFSGQYVGEVHIVSISLSIFSNPCSHWVRRWRHGDLFLLHGFAGRLAPAEILALVGVYVLIGGVIRFAIQPGMAQLIESVRDGTFDLH